MPNIAIEKLFKIAHDQKASDLHLLANKPPILRIAGKLSEIKDMPVLSGTDVEAIIKKMIDTNRWETFTKEKDLDLSYEISDGTRFRVNIHWSKGSPGLVARVVPVEIPTMEDVLMPEIVYQLMRLDQGLILVTGPTGCGKSTSLAAMINLINKERDLSIVTLEDPIEFIYKNEKSIIIQRQLGNDMATFASGLKHVLRQDPDVIMVGEMRDLETIAATITLAETGHLVLATLHTLNAAQTIDRIIDVFPPHQQPQVRLQVSMSLSAVISQRLIPKKGGGLIAAREIMINTPAVANLIRENKIAQIKTIIQTGADDGMVTMDQDLKRLVEEGTVEKDVAKLHMLNPNSLK